jgi:hypothetical protein
VRHHQIVNRIGAAALSALLFLVATPILTLLGAFMLRMALGVGTYRSSGVWVGVVIGAPVISAVLAAVLFWGLTSKNP